MQTRSSFRVTSIDSMSQPEQKIGESSANLIVFKCFNLLRKSLKYNRNNNELGNEACGLPDKIIHPFLLFTFVTIFWKL